jgi:hypothetical protein
MANESSSSSLSISRLIMVPALITLGVTILRLVGEVQHWSPRLFNPAPGGGGALVGIAWLPLIFGPYFAFKLLAAGEGPSSKGSAIGYALLGLVVLVAAVFISIKAGFGAPLILAVALVLMAGAVALQFRPWPALARALVGYAYAARVPVAIIMFFAIRGNWGTHYDGAPPNFPEMSFWPKYLLIALVPQFIFWVAFTVVIGALVGTLAATLQRSRAAAQ